MVSNVRMTCIIHTARKRQVNIAYSHISLYHFFTYRVDICPFLGIYNKHGSYQASKILTVRVLFRKLVLPV